MVLTSARITASMKRMPHPCKASKSSTSKAVIITAHNKRNAKKEFERHRPAEHFRQVAGTDGNFAEEPHRPAGPAGIIVPAGLSQVLARGHAETGGNDLHENGHDARQGHRPQQTEFILRSRIQPRRPVARIHVADTHEKRRSAKRT